MIEKPVFHAHITVRVLDANQVLLLLEDEGEERLIKGFCCGSVANFIDGNHTIDELVDQFRNRLTPEEVYYLLAKFEAGGYLTNAESESPPSVGSFWQMLGAKPETAMKRLRESTVSLTALGGTTTGELEVALSRLGLRIAQDGGFAVILTDDYLDQNLPDWNARALEARMPWMLGKPLGKTPWLGPIFRPGATACWTCLAYRLRENRRMAGPGGRADVIGDLRRSRAGLPSTIYAAANIMATEIAKYLVLGKSEALEDAVWTLDSSLRATTHRLTRQPQCESCGHAAIATGQPFDLQNRCKHTGVEGSHRAITAEETIRKLERHVSPITGIIPVVRRAEADANSAAHVYVALQSQALSLTAPTSATGKGVTDAEALAGCLAEAAERYSCCFHGGVRHLSARYADLSPKAVSAADLLNFSDRQYRERESWNAVHGSFQWVPERFDDTRDIEWTPVWSLTRKMERYLPTAFCYFQYPAYDRRFFQSDSNGCASGNSLEEAVLHGLLELVERDAVALWWYNRTNHPSVNLASFNDRFLSSTYDRLRHAKRELLLLDITSDLGIPCFEAISWRSDGTRIMFGSAADLDPRMAAIRAVCELNQMLEFAGREEARAAGEGTNSRAISDWLRTARIEDHGYVTSSRDIDATDFQSLSGSGLLDDIARCTSILECHGLEALVLDMTRPDIAFPTVRVTVPGLRHFWARFGPGRLYDVPVKLGYFSQPLTEAELNPIPYML